jgi:hypothetical protein
VIARRPFVNTSSSLQLPSNHRWNKKNQVTVALPRSQEQKFSENNTSIEGSKFFPHSSGLQQHPQEPNSLKKPCQLFFWFTIGSIGCILVLQEKLNR